MKRNKAIGIIFLTLVLSMGLISITNILSPPPRQFDLEGFIKDSGTGDGINDATVKLWVYDFVTGWIYVGSQLTESDGSYCFEDVPFGAKKIRASKSGYHTYEGAHQPIIYLDTFTYDYIFYGTIRNSVTSQALSEAVVDITCGTRIITDTTDNSGYYCIVFSYSSSGVRTFDVEVTKTGYNSYTTTIITDSGYENNDFYLKEIRSWLFIYDDGYVSTGDGTRVQYIVTENLLSDGSWEITYDAKLDYFYDLSMSKKFQVDLFNPNGNYWERNWIITDDATIEDVGGGRFHAYVYKTQTFVYTSEYSGDTVGIQGGVGSFGYSGLTLNWGAVLKFRIDTFNYGTAYPYSEWYANNGITYGFYGTYDSWMNTYEYPLGAWHLAMDSSRLL